MNYADFYAGSVTQGDDGLQDWTNPDNAEGEPDASDATCTLTAVNNFSENLIATDFDFSSIPEDVQIYGIGVFWYGSVNAANGAQLDNAQLVLDGSAIGDLDTDGVALPSSGADAQVMMGGDSNLWGYPIERSTLLDSTFGFQAKARHTLGLSISVAIDSAGMRIYYDFVNAAAIHRRRSRRRREELVGV